MVARPKGPLVLAIGLGILTSTGLVLYLQQQRAQQADETVVPLVVAVREMPAETKLELGDLAVRLVPRRLYPSNGLREPAEAAGRITKVPLFPDDPLLAGKLLAPGHAGGLSFTIPVGKRAVTVAVNEVTGVAGFLKPGHRVDVIGARRPQGNQTAKAQIVVQNMPVLAVAQDPEDKHGRKAKVVSSVTLLASPAEAEQITLASEQGDIRLALRASGDDALVKTPGAHWQEAGPVRTVAASRPQAGPPVPARPAAAPAALPPKPVIEVIRGSRRDVAGGH